MQDTKDPRSFTIVERYAHESSQKYVPWIPLHPIPCLNSPFIFPKLFTYFFLVRQIPPRKPLLANLRQVRRSIVGSGNGLATSE